MVGKNDATITNSYAIGTVSNTYSEGGGNNNIGGLVGENVSYYNATVTGSYWDMNTSGQQDLFDGRGVGESDDAIQQQATFVGWDFSTIGPLTGANPTHY